MRALPLLLLITCFACATSGRRGAGAEGDLEAQPTAAELADARARAARLRPVLDALQAGELPRAQASLGESPSDPEALAVRALLRWLTAAHDLANDLRTVGIGAMMGGTINGKYLFSSVETALEALEAVDGELARAQSSRVFALELCPACWRLDWDASGTSDDEDQELLEVEVDAQGEPLPADDPRRRPTFALDRGDLAWARAMVAFQRALLEVIQAYRWSGLGAAFARGRDATSVVIHLDDAGRVRRAAELIAEGVAGSRRARREYLAETDDDREWVPHPSQRSHAIPLPVDQALYTTWLAVLDDTDRLLSGEEGIDLGALAATVDASLAGRVSGFIDVHEMLQAPGDVRLDLGAWEDTPRDPQAAVQALLGGTWRASMKASQLAARLGRMQSEVDAGMEPWTRKLRYLLWLN